MDDFKVLTGYIFTLCSSLVDTINQSFILQFGVLLVFSYFAVSVFRKVYSDSDDGSKGGVAL